MSKFLRSFVFITIAFSFLLAACGTSATPTPQTVGSDSDTASASYILRARPCSANSASRWFGSNHRRWRDVPISALYTVVLCFPVC